jgi:hypothetical protein
MLLIVTLAMNTSGYSERRVYSLRTQKRAAGRVVQGAGKEILQALTGLNSSKRDFRNATRALASQEKWK